MKGKFMERLAAAGPFLPGLLAFLAVVGPRAVDPRNLAWLRGGDPSQHYLGWLFFRQSDWSLPLGASPDYGLELASSIVYSDSIPLLALFFKFFDAWLPHPFQYFGLWLLACFVLQGYFAWKLVGLLSTDALLRLPASLLLLFSPPMLARLGGHEALTGHFLILAALYVALHPDTNRRRLAWGMLLAIVTLVHAYFLAMVAAIWLADLAGRTWQHRTIALRTAYRELAGMLLIVIFTGWLAGYFSITSGLASGSYYGYFRANLLTFVDPGGWSYVLRDMPESGGDYEGFNYLGLGVILLALSAVPFFPAAIRDSRAALARNRWLLIALALLALFAFTNKLGLGALNVSIWVPSLFTDAAEAFRSSGRMLWPVFYMIILAILYTVLKGNSRSVAAVLLVLAVTAQVVDTRIGWGSYRRNLMAARSEFLVTPSPNPFWEEAAQRYVNVRVLPPANAPEHWVNIASFAGNHGMGTNGVYLARIDEDAFAAAYEQSMVSLATGQYAEDTLYILDETVVEQAMSTASEEDLLQRIDGMFVLAPGWLSRQSAQAEPR